MGFKLNRSKLWNEWAKTRNEALHQAIEDLSTYVPVSETDKYAEGYRDGLAQARKVLGEMLVE